MVPGLCCFNMRPFDLNYGIKRPTDKHNQDTAEIILCVCPAVTFTDVFLWAQLHYHMRPPEAL